MNDFIRGKYQKAIFDWVVNDRGDAAFAGSESGHRLYIKKVA